MLLVHLVVGKKNIAMKILPLIINIILLSVQTGMVVYVNTRTFFDEEGQRILIFYHNYTAYFVFFILLNSCAVFLIKPTKRVRNITLLVGAVAIVVYLLFYKDFNPY